MLKLRIRHSNDGTFIVRWRFHWYYDSFMVSCPTEQECTELVTKILRQAAEHHKKEQAEGMT